MKLNSFKDVCITIAKTLFPEYNVEFGLGKDYREFLQTRTLPIDTIFCSYQSHQSNQFFENAGVETRSFNIHISLATKDRLLDDVFAAFENLSNINIKFNDYAIAVYDEAGSFETINGKEIYNLMLKIEL